MTESTPAADPTPQLDRLLDSALSFRQALLDYLDAESAERVWSVTSDQLGPEIRGELMTRVLRGDFYRTITVTNINIQRYDRIKLIKAVRSATHWGLKEAKDATDALVSTKHLPMVLPLHLPGNDFFRRCISDLRDSGADV